MITREQYLMGRDVAFPEDFTPEISDNADVTIFKANAMYAEMAKDGVEPANDQVTGNWVASGLRPKAINDRTANAATLSPHLTAEGLDTQDHQDRRIARWCLGDKGRAAMARIGIWMEHPQWTSKKNLETGTRDPWVHWQTRPPLSGLRFFRPSLGPPTAPSLPGQVGVCAIFPYEEEVA